MREDRRKYRDILQGLRADEVVVGGRGGDDVAVAGDLAGEAGDGTGYLDECQ